MQWHPLPLNLTGDDIGALKEINSAVLSHLEGEQFFSFKPAILHKLEAELTRVAAKQESLSNVISKLASSPDHCTVQLQHSDNEILNLPWTLAKCGEEARALGSMSRLYLTKTLAPALKGKSLPRYEPMAAAPLKILIMISSPVDSEWKSVLSYDEEEREILKAFQPLMQSGDVEIDFTEDGSLEALAEKIRNNKYHIVHFSGHGIFKNNEGYLELENPVNLKAESVTGKEFAEALASNPEHLVPLVMLSSCQTAKGATEKGLCGVTNNLLRIGIPAVISMGMSIQDKYAATFAASFYGRIAKKRILAESFHQAVDAIRSKEAEDNAKNAYLAGRTPLQWIIPNLYLSAEIEHLVNWQTDHEPIRHRAYRFLTSQNRIILTHDENYRFIGRREDKAEILPALFAKTPILLKGQGGVGKTALAEKLVRLLIAKDPKTYPFVFTEKTRTIEAIETALKGYLTGEQKTYDFITALATMNKAVERVKFLIGQVSRYCAPVFVFDNLEDFQKEKGGAFAEEFAPIAEVIAFLCDSGDYHVILTCRYPTPDFPRVKPRELNQARFNDFWKKCAYLELKGLREALLENRIKKTETQHIPEKPEIEFVDIVRALYNKFGGNFRALEFFNKLYIANPQRIVSSLGSIEEFLKSTDIDTAEIREFMGKNLYFDELMSLLDPEETHLLSLLMRFRIPVQAYALMLQLRTGEKAAIEQKLEKLDDLTLVEISMDRELNLVYYYATPLIKDLLESSGLSGDSAAFSHESAGLYHYHISENVEFSLNELEEAFYHFHESKNGEKVNYIGETISNFYYRASLFRNALFYCLKVFEILQEGTNGSIINRTGLIFQLFGDLNNALKYYLQAQKKYKELGDKRGEGTTLNNISQIFKARGDYDTALEYLKKSLAIQQEIGDKSGEMTTLHNMAMIAYTKEDFQQYLSYESNSYSLAMEFGDAKGLFTIGKILGEVLCKAGQKDQGLQMLECSYEIGKKAGYPDANEVKSLLDKYQKE
jgi:CHAT domain-containing protein